MTEGSVTLSSWTETLKRIKKIKSMSKKMKLKISDIKVEQLPEKVVYNSGRRKTVENFKLTWNYSL